MLARSIPLASAMSVEEYLTLESTSSGKYEYLDGQVSAMAGGTLDHDRIANNVRIIIDAHLGDGPCVVCGPDVRLRVSPTAYLYPDALVICDETISGAAIEVTGPCLVVEVLSPSTERDDRGVKFAQYQAIPSCLEYLLVDTQHQVAERFYRAEPGLWLYQRCTADEHITLQSIALSCPVTAFYRRTSLLTTPTP